jgi:hypothetical protein
VDLPAVGRGTHLFEAQVRRYPPAPREPENEDGDGEEEVHRDARDEDHATRENARAVEASMLAAAGVFHGAFSFQAHEPAERDPVERERGASPCEQCFRAWRQPKAEFFDHDPGTLGRDEVSELMDQDETRDEQKKRERGENQKHGRAC